ncbi:AAWKG family protein, partial [Streptomyces sp. NPDC051664]|uniref:AAWKG family protein n=1 Tax=Streptomyces sp. NPDC051664 TaxID=3365668 RepID=UPI0037A3D003
MGAENWEQIIQLLTGFQLPDRNKITTKSVKDGDSNVPWIKVELKTIPAIDHFTNTISNNGLSWQFQFYERNGTDKVTMHQATVTIVDQLEGAQYWQRSEEALKMLLNEPYATNGSLDTENGAPGATKGIDLKSFTTLAQSFDQVGTFFKTHTETLKQWTEALGKENNAWGGVAAGVFWNLINNLHEEYDSYRLALMPANWQPEQTSRSTNYTSSTLHGDSVIGAEVELYKALTEIQDAYGKYITRSAAPITVTFPDGESRSTTVDGDTRMVMWEVMMETLQFLWDHNYTNILFRSNVGDLPDDGWNNPDRSWIGTTPAFRDTTAWGKLSDISTWTGIAHEAVRRWTNNVETNLDVPSRAAFQELGQGWSRQLDPIWNSAFTVPATPPAPLGGGDDGSAGGGGGGASFPKSGGGQGGGDLPSLGNLPSLGGGGAGGGQGGGDISTPHPSGDLPSLGNLPSLGGGGAGGGQGGGDISTPHPSGDLPSLGNLPSLGGGGAGGGQGG